MDTYDFLHDPRNLTLAERQAARRNLEREQNAWLARLQPLCEEPVLDSDFPAFLLATPPFSDLARQLGKASVRQDLPADVADELDWFLRVFRDYLRTADGEDAFGDEYAEDRRLTG